MAPELLVGHTESSAAIDVWSMGIILHGLVLGYLPFRSSNKDELRKMIIENKVRIASVKGKDQPSLSKNCRDLI